MLTQTDILQQNLHTQLDRLLDQTKDEMEIEEYREALQDTVDQLEEFSKSLEKMKTGADNGLSLCDDLQRRQNVIVLEREDWVPSSHSLFDPCIDYQMCDQQSLSDTWGHSILCKETTCSATQSLNWSKANDAFPEAHRICSRPLFLDRTWYEGAKTECCGRGAAEKKNSRCPEETRRSADAWRRAVAEALFWGRHRQVR